MQRAFSGYMAATGDHAYAAEKAGYAVPVNAGAGLMRKPDVAEEVRRRSRERLRSEGAEIGVDVLISVAKDTKQKGSTRVAAAKALVGLSGLASTADAAEGDLSELPAEKIQALLQETQRLLAERLAIANTVDHEPAPIADHAAPTGIFD